MAHCSSVTQQSHLKTQGILRHYLHRVVCFNVEISRLQKSKTGHYFYVYLMFLFFCCVLKLIDSYQISLCVFPLVQMMKKTMQSNVGTSNIPLKWPTACSLRPGIQMKPLPLVKPHQPVAKPAPNPVSSKIASVDSLYYNEDINKGIIV